MLLWVFTWITKNWPFILLKRVLYRVTGCANVNTQPSVYKLDFGISRISLFYVVNFFLITFLVVIASISCTIIHFTDFASRSSITFTVLLTIISFKFIMANYTPTINYLVCVCMQYVDLFFWRLFCSAYMSTSTQFELLLTVIFVCASIYCTDVAWLLQHHWNHFNYYGYISKFHHSSLPWRLRVCCSNGLYLTLLRWISMDYFSYGIVCGQLCRLVLWGLERCYLKQQRHDVWHPTCAQQGSDFYLMRRVVSAWLWWCGRVYYDTKISSWR